MHNHPLLLDFLRQEESSRGIYALPLPLFPDHRVDQPARNFFRRLMRTGPDWRQIGEEISREPTLEIALEMVGPFVVSRSPGSHVNEQRQALDFLVPMGTPVLAAEAGTVVETVHGHESGGPSREFVDQLNYITLRHPNGELTQYAHLAPCALPVVNSGQFVQRGQLLGHVGMSGWTDRPHLHFLVFRTISLPPGFKSLVPRFT